MAAEQGGGLIEYLQPLRMDPVTNTHFQVVIRRTARPTHVRKFEIVLLKTFHSTVTPKCSHLPYQNTIIPSPFVTPDSGVHLELREHLRIKSDTGRLELLTGIARGLRHIHDLDIIHNHLEFGTVEADRDGAVRISDSWKSSVLPSEVTGSTTDAQCRPSFIWGTSDFGLSRASSIEISKANYMYAFGLLAWELFAGEPPSRPSDSASAWLCRPDHRELSDEVWDMIEKCLEAEPSRRLTVTKVEIILEAEPVYVNWASPFGFL